MQKYNIMIKEQKKIDNRLVFIDVNIGLNARHPIFLFFESVSVLRLESNTVMFRYFVEDLPYVQRMYSSHPVKVITLL